ncbi:MAG: ABC transporter permease [Treponema sp.]|jgi:lipoprotein-releasing system permease protein|nr:ABC transporter permease [Treponema sp.]
MRTTAAFFIAIRYLLGRAKEGGRYLRGAAAGIALSLIPIVVTLIVADGMIRGITERFLELGTGHLQIRNNSFDPRFPEEVLEQLKGFEGLRGAWAEMYGIGVLVGNGASTGATIRAVDESFWEDEGSLRYLKVIEGEAKVKGERDVLLGEDLAHTLNVKAGNNVRIMTLSLGLDGRSIPRVQVFTVKGIISSGYKELDSLWCVMNLEAGRRFLPENTPSYLILKIDDPYGGIDDAAADLDNRISSGYAIETWKHLQYAQYSSYESTRQILLFIMAIIVIVAAVNVSSATSMLAIERQKDIAVLKTGGASPGFTSRVFLFASFLTGVCGSVIGISLGLIIGVSINSVIRFIESFLSFFTGLFQGDPVLILDSGFYLESIPIVIDWVTVAFIAFFTVLSSILASAIPAARAGKLKVLDVLRKH